MTKKKSSNGHAKRNRGAGGAVRGPRAKAADKNRKAGGGKERVYGPRTDEERGKMEAVIISPGGAARLPKPYEWALLHAEHLLRELLGRYDEADVVLSALTRVVESEGQARAERLTALGGTHRDEALWDELVRAARKYCGLTPGRGMSKSKGRRPDLVKALLRQSMRCRALGRETRYIVRNELRDACKTLEAYGGHLPSPEDIETVIRRLMEPSYKGEPTDAIEARFLGDGERFARAVLDACGVNGKAWLESALDK